VGNRSLNPRRQPTQERSRQRVEVILDTVSDILIERGVEAVTTNLIAEKADIPIGSVYQFFPNKFAIFRALLDRFFLQIDAVFERFLSLEGPPLAWEERSDRTIEALARLWLREKAVAILWMGARHTPEMRSAAAEQFKKSEQYHLALLENIQPNMTPLRRRTVARVLVNVGEELLALSVKGTPKERRQLVNEAKLLMRSYLGAFIEPGNTAQKKRSSQPDR